MYEETAASPQPVNRYTWITRPMVIFVVTRLLLIAMALISQQLGSHRPPLYPEQPFLDIWAKWDSELYIDIAGDGYNYIPNDYSNTAFFPLYPLLMRILSVPLGGNLLLSGVLLSNAFALAALMMIYRLTEKQLHSAHIATLTVLYMCIFPNSFFLSAVYTESLFLLLSVLVFWECSQERWGYAVFYGALSTATRFNGLIMFGVIGLFWLNAQGWYLLRRPSLAWIRDFTLHIVQGWRTILLFTLTFAGLGAFMLFLWVDQGDPFAFSKAQAAWGRTYIGPIAVTIDTIQTYLEGRNKTWPAPFDLTLALTALALIPMIWKRIGEPHAAYVLVSILIPFSTTTLSMNRFLLILFPLFMLLGTWGEKNRLFHVVYTSLSILAMCFTMVIWSTGYFIA